MAQSTILRAKNLTGATLSASTVVYISGFDIVSNVPLIAKASNDDESKMPAVGIIREDIANGNIDIVKINGPITGFDTSNVSSNTNVYVGQNGGVVYANEPSSTNRNLLTQQLGTVARAADYPNGQIQLYPLETKRRISHPDLIDVSINQHHSKLHSGTHEAFGADLVNHSKLSNLTADTHSQYILANGTRTFTGVVGGQIPTVYTHLATKGYVDTEFSSKFGAGVGADGYLTFFTGPDAIAGDNDLFFNRENHYLTLTGGGRMGIGLINPGYRLDVYDNAASSYAARFSNDGNSSNRYGILIKCGADVQTSGMHYYFTAADGDGDVEGWLRVNAGTFELVQASDQRLKTNIAPTKVNGLNIVNKLLLKEYKRKKRGALDNTAGTLHPIGFLAQDCETIFSPMTGDGPDGTKCISMAALVPVLTKAIQELNTKLDTALDRIEQLEK